MSATPPAKIRVLLVDDHPVVRAGLAATLSSAPDIEVCGEAGQVRQALDLIRNSDPHLVLVDLDLDEGSGLDVIKEALAWKPGLPLVVVSVHDEELYAERALRAGARGYLRKSIPPAELLAAIRAVLAGGLAVSEKVKNGVVRKLAQGTEPGKHELSGLSDRELQVFRLIGRGLSTKSIAESLSLSVKTVETHMAHLKRKLNLSSSVQLRHRASREDRLEG